MFWGYEIVMRKTFYFLCGGFTFSGVWAAVTTSDWSWLFLSVIAILAAAGNAWVLYRKTEKLAQIDSELYKKQKMLDLELYEKRLEHESGIDLHSLDGDNAL